MNAGKKRRRERRSPGGEFVARDADAAIGRIVAETSDEEKVAKELTASAPVTQLNDEAVQPEPSDGAPADEKVDAGRMEPASSAHLEPQKVQRAVRLVELARTNTIFTDHLQNYLNSIVGNTQRLSSANLDAALGAHFADSELTELRASVAAKIRELEQEQLTRAEKTRRIEELEAMVSDLRQREDLGYLLSRVNEAAQKKLRSDQAFREQLVDGKECKAFVLSVDIRRSTELMLKARSAQLFASFLTELCDEMFDCVVRNYGVFDKFSGDGVLAFFPESVAGPDACFYAIKAAEDCHAAFERKYRGSRTSFSSVLKDTGLGVGIDYGDVRLLRVGGGLTVLGVPVVYACRLSGARAGTTLLNQPAYEQASARLSSNTVIAEASLEIKHEGEIVVYDTKFNQVAYVPIVPEWTQS